MNNQTISIISLDHVYESSSNENKNRRMKKDDVDITLKEKLPCPQNISHQHDNVEINFGYDGSQEFENGNDEVEDSSERRMNSKPPNQENEIYSKLRKIIRSVVLSIGIIAACILCVVPWTTIPRTNSILYQSWWMEMCLPSACYYFLNATAELLNLKVWTKERSINSVKVLLKLFLALLIPFLLLDVSCYMIWTVYFGLNHPMPQLGLAVNFPTKIIFIIELWIVLPSDALLKQNFRKKLQTYMVYFAWFVTMIAQNEILSYLFHNISSDWQFLVPFLIAACREFDQYMRSRMINKMMGGMDESATALLTITVNTMYGIFVAVRLAGATWDTVLCVVAIDFFIHLAITYQVIKHHEKVAIEENGQTNSKRDIYTAQLVVSELTEALVPIVYATCMMLAIYGPNSSILANVGSTYWGKKVESIGPLLYSMAILFLFDTVSMLVTSVVLWKVSNINMLQQFNDGINKYWLFLVIKVGLSMSGYFAFTDINAGMDSSGSYDWITPEGRLNLIYNSTDLSEEEKLMLLESI